MAVLFFLLAIGAFVVGALLFGVSKSAIHEIEAGIAFLLGGLFVVSSMICDGVNRIIKSLRSNAKQQNEQSAESHKLIEVQQEKCRQLLEEIAPLVADLAADSDWNRDIKKKELERSRALEAARRKNKES